MEEIAGQLKKLRFRKKFIGGVDEADVWKQLELLQGDYRVVLNKAIRICYECIGIG